jgi:hypothetical protein
MAAVRLAISTSNPEFHKGEANPRFMKKQIGHHIAKVGQGGVVTLTQYRAADQTIPGKDRPTKSITSKEAAPIASAIIVSLDRTIAVLMSLAILLLPQCLFAFVASLFHMVNSV